VWDCMHFWAFFGLRGGNCCMDPIYSGRWNIQGTYRQHVRATGCREQLDELRVRQSHSMEKSREQQELDMENHIEPSRLISTSGKGLIRNAMPTNAHADLIRVPTTHCKKILYKRNEEKGKRRTTIKVRP